MVHDFAEVMSILWPAEDMPWSESGLTPDILFNPHGVVVAKYDYIRLFIYINKTICIRLYIYKTIYIYICAYGTYIYIFIYLFIKLFIYLFYLFIYTCVRVYVMYNDWLCNLCM